MHHQKDDQQTKASHNQNENNILNLEIKLKVYLKNVKNFSQPLFSKLKKRSCKYKDCRGKTSPK